MYTLLDKACVVFSTLGKLIIHTPLPVQTCQSEAASSVHIQSFYNLERRINNYPQIVNTQPIPQSGHCVRLFNDQIHSKSILSPNIVYCACTLGPQPFPKS